MDLKEALRRNPDMGRLQPRDLDVLAAAFAVEEHPHDHVFVTEGERSDAAWLLLDGEVSVTRAREPYVDEIERLHPGDMFGLAGLVADARRSASCRAAGPVTVGRIDKYALGMLMRDDAPVGLALQHAVARQLAADYRNIARRVREALRARG